MPSYERITSFQNPRIKLAKQLQDKKHREREQLFIVDYRRDLERALNHAYEVMFLLVCPPLLHDSDYAVLQSIAVEKIFEVTPDLLEKAGYRQNPSGILAVLKAKPVRSLPTHPPLHQKPILGLVGLEKPGNIGALLRTADATGFTTVFLIDTSLDLYNPNIVRSSTGACFLNNVYQLTSMDALDFFKRQKYSIISGHLEGTQSLFELTFTNQSAVLLGSEDDGLTEFWKHQCDSLVKIPMVGELSDSLNVSVSGAVFMYEALRQRQLQSLL